MPYKEKISGIYKITNKATGFNYIGSSSHIMVRWVHHKSTLKAGKHRNRHMQRDHDRHGIKSFELVILEKSNASDLFILEQKYLDKHLAAGNCYNIYSNADNTNQRTFETLSIMSRANKGKKQPNETRTKISQSLRGNPNIGHKGSENPSAILCEGDIPEIRRLLKTRLSCQKIGNIFGVSRHAIWSIKSGKSWTHVK